MDKFKWYIIFMSVVLSLFFLLFYFLGLLNVSISVLITIYFFVLFFGFLYLSKSFLDDELFFDKNKKNFSFAFKRVNDILKEKSGGVSLSWKGSFNFESQLKSLYVSKDGKSHYFRSFLGDVQNSDGSIQSTLIIYDIDLDDIVYFKPNPSKEELKNHFYLFNPSGSGGGFGFNNFRRENEEILPLPVKDFNIENQNNNNNNISSFEKENFKEKQDDNNLF